MNMIKMVSANQHMTQVHTHNAISHLDTVQSLDFDFHGQEDFDSCRAVRSSKRGSNSGEAVSRHHHFLQQKMTSFVNARLSASASSSSPVGVPSVKTSCEEEAWSVEGMRSESGVRKLRSVLCELEEVALTLVYSDGSSQLRRSPTSVRNNYYNEWENC